MINVINRFVATFKRSYYKLSYGEELETELIFSCWFKSLSMNIVISYQRTNTDSESDKTCGRISAMGVMKKGLFGCHLKHQVTAIALTYSVSLLSQSRLQHYHRAGSLGGLNNIRISSLPPPREILKRSWQPFRFRKDSHFLSIHWLYLDDSDKNICRANMKCEIRKFEPSFQREKEEGLRLKIEQIISMVTSTVWTRIFLQCLQELS